MCIGSIVVLIDVVLVSLEQESNARMRKVAYMGIHVPDVAVALKSVCSANALNQPIFGTDGN